MAEFLGLEILTDAMLIGMWKIEVFIFMMSFNASIVYLVWFLNKLSIDLVLLFIEMKCRYFKGKHTKQKSKAVQAVLCPGK